MNSPGYHSIGDYTITAAGLYVPDTGDHLGGLAGIVGATVQLNFRYGTSGTSGKCYLQTSIDQADQGGTPGGSWMDIACVAFALASEAWVFNFTNAPKTTPVTPTDGALADDTAIDSILGDRFRLKLVTLGTYATSTIFSGRLIAR